MTFLSSTDLWDLSPDGFILVDQHGLIRSANQSATTMFGFPLDDGPSPLLGQPVEAFIPPELRDGHAALRDAFFSDATSRSMGSARNLLALNDDGVPFPVTITLTPIRIDDESFVLASVRDLTDRARFEQRLTDANRKRARAEDSDRIATELHDNVVQRLFVLGLDLHQLSSKVVDPTAIDRLSVAVDTIDDTIKEIRNTIFDLTSPRLPSVSLRQDVEEIALQLERRRGITTRLSFEGAVDELDSIVHGHHVRRVVRQTIDLFASEASTQAVSIHIAAGDSLSVEIAGETETRTPAPLVAELANVNVALSGADVNVEHDDTTTRLMWSLML